MPIIKIDNCYGCESCVRCGRHVSSYSVTCDSCGEQKDEFIDINDTLLCFRCLKSKIQSEEGYCDDCEEEDLLYNPEQGVWICENCLETYFDNRKISAEHIIERWLD